MAEPSCAAVAASRDEPLYATASIARSWVLLEQPGPWGRDAVLESRLPAPVASGLVALSRRYGFRLLLLRRVSAPSPPAERRCFIAHSARGQEWIEEAALPDAGALLDVDFGSLAGGTPTGFGALRPDPLYLVCTNGRHDPCCARLGRPVARTLPAAVADSVWECSHIGGDRFAANLVCLPHSLYFGRLAEDDAVRVVDSYRQGLIELDHFRGRAGDPYAVQAAEYFVRRRDGLRGIDDVVPVSWHTVRPGVVEVDLRGPGGSSVEVVVGVDPAPESRLLTCRAAVPGRPPTFSLLDLRVS